MTMRGPFKILPRLASEVRLTAISGREVLAEFRGDDLDSARSLFVFPSEKEASELPGVLDQAQDLDTFYAAFRTAAYGVSLPSIDSDDRFGIYGDLQRMPATLRALLAQPPADLSFLVPQDLSEGSIEAVWARNIQAAPAPAPTPKPVAAGKAYGRYSRLSDRPGEIPVDLAYKFKKAVQECGLDPASEPMPVSPLGVATRTDELLALARSRKDRSELASEAQIKFVASIAQRLGIVPPFTLERASKQQASIFIGRHKGRFLAMSGRRR